MENKIPPDIKLIKIDDNTLGQFLFNKIQHAIDIDDLQNLINVPAPMFSHSLFNALSSTFAKFIVDFVKEGEEDSVLEKFNGYVTYILKETCGNTTN